jgi:hypothetical protein
MAYPLRVEIQQKRHEGAANWFLGSLKTNGTRIAHSLVTEPSD